jgi:putative endonuclease
MGFFSNKIKEQIPVDNRTDKRKLGDIGENAVCEYLKSRGFSIVEQNYLRKWGELDIVFKKGGKLHFIEVKSISHEIVGESDAKISHENTDQYRAEDNLHPHKLERLKRAIQTYILDRKIGDHVDWQFDVATVLVDQQRKICKVTILEDIIL